MSATAHPTLPTPPDDAVEARERTAAIPATAAPPAAPAAAAPARSPAYGSRRYAMLNRPIESTRHLRRVCRFLEPRWHDRVLEVGCGRGHLTKRVQALAPDTVGVDLNPESIAHGVTDGLRVMDATCLAYADASFDKVYSFHMLEHVPDVRAALGEMARVLRAGGRLLLVYPAEPVRGLYVVPTALVVFGNPLRARELHLHKLTPTRIARLAAGTGLEVVTSRLELLLTPQFVTLLTKTGDR